MTNQLIEEKLKEFETLWIERDTYPPDGKEMIKNLFKTSLNEVYQQGCDESFGKSYDAVRVKIREEERKEIYQDLMKVADEGQYEDLRREVERYFKKIINKV